MASEPREYPESVRMILDEMADEYDLEYLAEVNGAGCACRQMQVLKQYRAVEALPPYPRAVDARRKKLGTAKANH